MVLSRCGRGVPSTLFGRYQIAGANAHGIMHWWQLIGSMLAGAAWVSGEIAGRMLFYHHIMSHFPCTDISSGQLVVGARAAGCFFTGQRARQKKP